MRTRLFAISEGYLKDLSSRTEKVVTDKRQMMKLIADEVNVHQVIEKTEDSKGNKVQLIYETDLGSPGYKFMDEK